MGSGQSLDDILSVFEALGSRTRLDILSQLREPRRLVEIRPRTQRTHGPTRRERVVSRQAVWKHLEVLCESGLVRVDRDERGPIFTADLASLERRIADLRAYMKTTADA